MSNQAGLNQILKMAINSMTEDNTTETDLSSRSVQDLQGGWNWVFLMDWNIKWGASSQRSFRMGSGDSMISTFDVPPPASG